MFLEVTQIMKKKKILWITNNIRLRRKIIDVYFFWYLNALALNWFFYDPCWMLQLSEFVWTLRSSAWGVFNLLDATDRSKISRDQKRLFFAVSLYPLFIFREHSL